MKELWIELAIKHTEEMNKRFPKEIEKSIKETKVYDVDFERKGTERFPKTSVSVLDMDSTSAVMKFSEPKKRTAVLNFASYKHPGGMFLNGSRAQEECLCHDSTLYNVISAAKDYYEWNNKNLNKALYFNRALYSPGIVFIKDSEETKCDVITCASPNFRTYGKHNKDLELNSYVFRDRIRYVLSVAADNHVDTLILGAFGCGVFMQDPVQAALYFDEFLMTDFKNTFETVIFAVPSSNNKNFKAFKENIDEVN